jgi:asparagine synthase (glutamine-hydrolysing)
MTALAGIWSFRDTQNVAQECVRMLNAQMVYGREPERFWAGPAIALGQRMTKLLPEDDYDAQPVRGRESVLVGDLRLDNREELTAELGISAGRAKTMPDSALVLAAFERWDEDCCAHLVGDYAFAIWNERTHRLILARDIIGWRPLHFHRSENFFAFASMPKGLHALADIPRAPNEERVAELLTLLPQYGSTSFFVGIERVEPGHVMTITRSGFHKRRYWNWNRRALSLRKPEDYVEGVRHHLEQAVKSQLRGRGNRVAACLSAGLDSSAVVTTAARLLEPAGGRVVAITAVPPGDYDVPAPERRLSDEGPLAAATAATYPNIEHVLVTSNDRTPLDTLDKDFFLFDAPIMNLCVWLWGRIINDEVRARGLTVLLTGGMGNMTISYDGSERLAELVKSGRWLEWLRMMAAIRRAHHWRLRGALLATVAPWLPRRTWKFLSRIYYRESRDIQTYSAIHPQRLSELDLEARARAHGLDFTYRPWRDGVARRLWVLNRADVGNYHHGTLAGWGIDVRDPTTDRRLIEFCLSVPTEQFFRNGVPRALARAALADRVPAEVLNERRRGLQAVDWHEGMTAARNQILDEIGRLEQNGPAVRALDLHRMRRLAENWPSEGWHREDIIEQYRLALLRGISVGHFLRRASGGNA